MERRRRATVRLHGGRGHRPVRDHAHSRRPARRGARDPRSRHARRADGALRDRPPAKGRPALVEVSLSVSPIRDGSGRVIGASKIARDIAERRRADETAAYLAAIVSSSTDAIVGKTLDGIIRSWNRAAEHLFGYSADEVIGRPITILIPSERLHEEDDVLRRIRRGERVEHYETVRVRRDGSEVEVSLTISPVRNAAGRDHRGLEDRPGHHPAQAGREGPRDAPRSGAGGPGGGRGRQPGQGRVPRHALPRAAHPAERDPRMGPRARPGPVGSPGRGARARHHHAERATASPADRGSARHLQHHQRALPPESTTRGPGRRARPPRSRASGRRCRPRGSGSRLSSIRRSAPSRETPAGWNRSSGISCRMR